MSPMPDPPRLRPMQSTRRKLVVLHEDGTTTHTVANVVHAPDTEPADWTAIVQARPAGWGRP
jgi:hypothetical protein